MPDKEHSKNFFKLDDMKQELERDYAPVEIEVGDDVVVLRHFMRLPTADRKAVMAVVHELPSQDEREAMTDDQLEALESAIEKVLRTVAAEGKGGKLVDALGEDLALKSRIFNLWTESTDLGEAPNSPA